MAKKIRGTAEEAHNWINDSLLSETHKEALLNFVENFPTLTYFKKERPETDPAWLKELGRVFVGVASEDLLWYQFKHFDHSEYDDYRYQDSFYNYQGFAKDLGEYSEILLEGEPLLIVACVLENLGSILAVKGGDSSNDMTVYDFSYDDIERKGNGAGKIDESNTRRAFSSYTELLSRVSAVKFSEDNIVEAED